MIGLLRAQHLLYRLRPVEKADGRRYANFDRLMAAQMRRTFNAVARRRPAASRLLQFANNGATESMVAGWVSGRIKDVSIEGILNVARLAMASANKEYGGTATDLPPQAVEIIRSYRQAHAKEVARAVSEQMEIALDSKRESAAELEDEIDRLVQRRMQSLSEFAVTTAIEHAKASSEAPRRWILSPESRVCKICARNAASGIIESGDEFPSGDESPPAHPNCRCRLEIIRADAA
jgi:hypothetical protein